MCLPPCLDTPPTVTKQVALDPKRSKDFKPFPKASTGAGVVRVRDHTLESTSLDACSISLIGELITWIQCATMLS